MTSFLIGIGIVYAGVLAGFMLAMRNAPSIPYARQPPGRTNVVNLDERRRLRADE